MVFKDPIRIVTSQWFASPLAPQKASVALYMVIIIYTIYHKIYDELISFFKVEIYNSFGISKLTPPSQKNVLIYMFSVSSYLASSKSSPFCKAF